MSEEKLVQYTLEDLLSAAQGNFNGMVFVTIAYLREHDLSPVDMWHFIGKQFALTWRSDVDALGMAEGAAINWASVGAKPVETHGDSSRATVVLRDWPSSEVLEEFGTTREEADTLFEIMRPIADRLGLDYEWKREDDHVIQVYTKK